MLHKLLLLVCFCLFVVSAQECRLVSDCNSLKIFGGNVLNINGIDSNFSCSSLPPHFHNVVVSFLKKIQNQFLPVSCLTSSVFGVQQLRSGEEVLCDNGWTVFQHRSDESVDFDRTWQDYKNGFGNLSGEFWLGLDKIHSLTGMKSCKLRVDLTSFNNKQAFAEYRVFSVNNESDNYRIHVDDYNSSSTAGDGLLIAGRYHDDMQFSTKDKDNDLDSYSNCASFFGGGWWFNHCFYACLNCEHTSYRISWQPFSTPFKASTMKLRCN